MMGRIGRLVALLACATATARPPPPWRYDRSAFPAAWFGANSTHAESEAQLAELGRYQLVLFGFQHLLTRDDYRAEGAALIRQARAVKRRHPHVAVGIYVDVRGPPLAAHPCPPGPHGR